MKRQSAVPWPLKRTPEGLWWEVLAGEDEKAWVWLEEGRVQGMEV